MTPLVQHKSQEWWDAALQARQDEAEEQRSTSFDEDDDLLDVEIPMSPEDEELAAPDVIAITPSLGEHLLARSEPDLLNLTSAWPFTVQETQTLREALACYGSLLVQQQLQAGEVLASWEQPTAVRDAARSVASRIMEADERLEDLVVRFPELAFTGGSWPSSPTTAERRVE